MAIKGYITLNWPAAPFTTFSSLALVIKCVGARVGGLGLVIDVLRTEANVVRILCIVKRVGGCDNLSGVV